jgi:hypothetical protein
MQIILIFILYIGLMLKNVFNVKNNISIELIINILKHFILY